MKTFSPWRLFARNSAKDFPAFIESESRFNGKVKWIYTMLFRLCKAKDHCWPSQQRLLERSGDSLRTIYSALKTLEECGYIHIVRTGRHNIYYLLYSETVQERIAACKEAIYPNTIQNFDPNRSAKFATYINRRDLNTNTPLSPLPKPESVAAPVVKPIAEQQPPSSFVPPSQQRRKGFPQSEVSRKGDFIAPQRKPQTTVQPKPLRSHHAQPWRGAFEAFWKSWPETAAWDMPRNRMMAMRIFNSLSRSGQLPEVAVLLESVEKFKAQDDRWKNGYAPEPSNWLRNKGWLQEPLIRQKKASSPMSVLPVVDPVRAAAVAKDYETMRDNCVKAFSDTPPSEAVMRLEESTKALNKLWPDAPPTLQPHLFRLHLHGENLTQLVQKATDYVASTDSPVSVMQWLKEYVYA